MWIRIRYAFVFLAIFSFGCEGETGRPEYPTYTKTLWELAQEQPELTRYVQLCTATGLDATLRSTAATLSPLAPSNAAFAARTDLPTTDLARMNEVLRFHMLSGSVDSTLMRIGGDFRTLTATTVRIEYIDTA